MTTDRRNYADGTYVEQSYPWGYYHAARVICSDGITRNVKRIAATPDTFFSIPAAVTVAGRTVSGYVTFETRDGFSTDTPDDPTVAKFIAYQYGKNADALPAGPHRPEVTR
jgi:hypothetical protein